MTSHTTVTPTSAIFFLAIILLLLGLVGQQDYEDARTLECWQYNHQRYDPKTDTCVKP